MQSPLFWWRRDITHRRRRGKAAGSAPRGRALLALLLLGAGALAGCRDGRRPPNVILVTVDTLRADRLGCYGNPLGLTPNIDALARRGTRFTAAYAAAPSTFASLVALLTGRHPEETGALNNYGFLPPEFQTIASALRARGWRTAAVVSNYVLSPRSGLAAGFDRYDATFPQVEAVRKVPERIASETRAAALRLVDSLDRGGAPLFLWVHFQDPHGPYNPPGDLKQRYLAAERAAPGGKVLLPLSKDVRGIGGIPTYQVLPGRREAARYRAAYDGEVRYADAEIGRLLDGLSARGLLGNAVLVFAADHGEGMGEGDYWFAHGEYLSEPLLHVPLIIVAPQGRAPAGAAGERGDLASLVDVFPTIAGLVGLRPPAGLAGQDLFGGAAPGGAGGRSRPPREIYFRTLPKESTLPRFGVARGGYRYVVTVVDGGRREELEALGGGGENLIDRKPGVARSLGAALASFRRRFPAEGGARKRTLTAAERDKLRSLGYVSE